MTFKTATGKEFQCDFCFESTQQHLVQMHIIDLDSFDDAVKLFTDTSEYPFVDFEEYDAVKSISDGLVGVEVTLRRRKDPLPSEAFFDRNRLVQ